MLMISDNLLIKYLEAEEKYKLDEFINNKRFTVADTPLTYRQTNSLDEANLLPEDKNRNNGWRKFSFKDLIYFLIVSDLKKFGLEYNQLRELWEAFFKELGDKKKVGRESKFLADFVIGCIFGQVEMTLRINSDGNIGFYDPLHLLFFARSKQPEITLVVNTYVNNLLKKVGKNEIPVKWTVLSEVLDKPSITTKESEILKIIRDNAYSGISIKKKDGENYIIYAEKTNNSDNDTKVEDLIKLLKEKDFQDISIIQRNGKIVNYKVEETIKL